MSRYLKLAAILLIAYSILAGMLIPLGTGVLNVSPSTAKGGEELALSLKTYNSVFDQNKGSFEARIRLNPEQAICTKKFKVSNSNELILYFDIPPGKLPVQTKMENGKKSPFPLLEMFDNVNGYTSLESVVFLKESESDSLSVQAFCNVVTYNNIEKTSFPFLNILEETIRNLFYHVPMWFAMMILLLMSAVYSIKYLINPQFGDYDIKSSSLASIGVLFGFVGIATGALWARHTWGAYWSFDVKQNTSAIALLIYLAYFVLRSSFDDMDKRARISAIYNIFAFATLIPLLYVIPRLVDSLHPGMGNNPAFSKLDLDNTMRMVFYPAVIGWILMGFWMAELATRIEKIRERKLEEDF
jgi:heme exporter protein C